MLAGNATARLVDDVEAAVDMLAATRASVSSPAVYELLATLDDAATSALDVAAPRAVSSPELDWSLGDNGTRAESRVTAAVADTTTSALDEATREGGDGEAETAATAAAIHAASSLFSSLFVRASEPCS